MNGRRADSMGSTGRRLPLPLHFKPSNKVLSKIIKKRIVVSTMRCLIRISTILALFWVSFSIFASCAPDSFLMNLLPCGRMTHESVVCPMIILSSTKDVAEAVLIFKNFALFTILIVVVVAVLSGPIFKKLSELLKNFHPQVFHIPILFANWLAWAFKTGLLNSKTF